MAEPEILRVWRHVHPRKDRPPEYWAVYAANKKATKLARARRRLKKWPTFEMPKPFPVKPEWVSSAAEYPIVFAEQGK